MKIFLMFLLSQKSSIFYDNTFIFKENPFFCKRENFFTFYFEHFSYDWKVIINNGESYRWNYTQYLFYSSFYKKFIFTEFIYSKEGDFKNEIEIAEIVNGNPEIIDSIKEISTTFIGRISFLLSSKKHLIFLNGKIIYYSHPLFSSQWIKYTLRDTFIYKFKKYAFCADIGIGYNINKNLYSFLLIENLLKTKLDYFIRYLPGTSFFPISNLPFTMRAGINYNRSNFKILFLISHFLFNKFGGSEVFIDEYIFLKPELSFIINYEKNKNHFNFSLSNKFYTWDYKSNPENIIELYLGYTREIKKIKIGCGIKFDTRFMEVSKEIVNGRVWLSPLNIFFTFYFNNFNH